MQLWFPDVNEDQDPKPFDPILDAAAKMGDGQLLNLTDQLHDYIRSRRGPTGRTHSYAVVRFGAEWQIACARGRIGHFHSRASAVITASRLAAQAAEAGFVTELLVQEPAGELVRHEVSGELNLPELDEDKFWGWTDEGQGEETTPSA